MGVQLLHGLFMQAMAGICPKEVQEVIRGWGRYKETVDTLAKEERDKITKLADLIVSSFSVVGCSPLGQITIVGHADHDFQGAAFEKKVSNERALNVTAALTTEIIDLWKKRKMGPFSKGAIAFEPPPQGVGATIPDPVNVPVVKKREMNRRVEITIRPRGAPNPPPDTLELRVARCLALLATKSVDPDPKGKRTGRAKCVLPKLLQPGVRDLFVNGMASNEQIGKQFIGEKLASFAGWYDPPEISNTDLMKFLGTVSSIIKGPGFARTVPDDQILKGLSAVMEAISEGIVQVQQYITLKSAEGTYAGDQTRARKLNPIFSDHLDDPNSIYSCYKDLKGRE
jgi:hypothetical protein